MKVIPALKAETALAMAVGGALVGGGIAVGRYLVPISSNSVAPTTSAAPAAPSPSSGTTAPAPPAAAPVPLISSATTGQTTSFVVPGPGGIPLVFVRKSGGSLWDYTYAKGAWQAEEIANSGVASDPVALVGSDGAPRVFYEGDGGSLWTDSYTGGTWHPAAVVKSGAASAPVSVLGADGAPRVFYEGDGGTLWTAGLTGNSWPTSEIASSGVTSAPSAVVESDGSFSVFCQEAGGSLWNYISQNGGWMPYEIAKTGVASPPAAILQAQGTPSVFYRSSDNELWDYSFVSAGDWTSNAVSADLVPTGSFYGEPSVIARPNATNAPTVFVQGPYNMLLTLSQTFSSGGWIAGQVAKPGSVSAAPGSALQTDGGQCTFLFGPGGTLWDYWFQHGTWAAADIVPSGVT